MSWFYFDDDDEQENVYHNSIIINNNQGTIGNPEISNSNGKSTFNISLGNDFTFRWEKGRTSGQISVDAPTKKAARRKAVKHIRTMCNINISEYDLY